MTYKCSIGISPSRLVTFIIQLFDSSISDRNSFKNSIFLWNSQDRVMIDRGFVISDELQELCVALDIPCEAFIQAYFSTAMFPQRLWRLGVVVITTTQLHSTKPELRFCAGSNPARGVSEIRGGEDL